MDIYDYFLTEVKFHGNKIIGFKARACYSGTLWSSLILAHNFFF